MLARRCTPPLSIPPTPDLADWRECADDYWSALLNALAAWHVQHISHAPSVVRALADALVVADQNAYLFTGNRTTHRRALSNSGPPPRRSRKPTSLLESSSARLVQGETHVCSGN